MATSKQTTVKVELLGQQFTLRGEDDPAHLERVADYVRRKLGDVGAGTRSVAPTKLALLTALNIADEHLKTVDENEHLKQEVESRSRRLLELLDQL